MQSTRVVQNDQVDSSVADREAAAAAGVAVAAVDAATNQSSNSLMSLEADRISQPGSFVAAAVEVAAAAAGAKADAAGSVEEEVRHSAAWVA